MLLKNKDNHTFIFINPVLKVDLLIFFSYYVYIIFLLYKQSILTCIITFLLYELLLNIIC